MRIYPVISCLGIVFLSLSLGIVYADQSTISKYCNNGTCSTGSVTILPSNYTYSSIHLPVLLISYSQTCENMIKNHIKGCTPIDDIIPFDTSNQYVSGKFVKQGNDTIRTSPQVKNNWLYYKYAPKKVTCFECTFDISSTLESQQIIIEPTSYSFVDKNANIVKDKWSYLNDRYMQGCDVATISSKSGLLKDTIHYMLSDCKQTNFNGNVTNLVHQTPWDYNNPFSSLLQKSYLKNIIPNHSATNTNHTSGGYGPSLCINGKTCEFKDPYAKKGY